MTMLDPEGPARHALCARSLEDKVADVCPTCGQHIIRGVAARVQWIMEGGTVTCENCGVEKTRGTASPVPEPVVIPAATAPAPIEPVTTHYEPSVRTYAGCGHEVPFSDLAQMLAEKGYPCTLQDVASWGSEKRARAARYARGETV